MLFSVNIGSPLKTGPTSLTPGISLKVITLITPLELITLLKSIFFIFPFAIVLYPIAPWIKLLGSKISSVYLADPETCFLALSCSFIFENKLFFLIKN